MKHQQHTSTDWVLPCKSWAFAYTRLLKLLTLQCVKGINSLVVAEDPAALCHDLKREETASKVLQPTTCNQPELISDWLANW